MKTRRKKSNKLANFNVMLFLLLVFANVIFTSSIATIGYKVEKLKVAVDKQSNKNQSLTMKVNELASPEHVQLVAQNLGLEYNNNNIVTISE